MELEPGTVGAAQLVDLPLPPASTGPHYAQWGQRATASLIDVAVPLVGLSVAFAVMTLFGSALGLLLALAGVVFHIWQVFLIQGKTGQTFGKARVGISLRRESDMAPIGVPMNVARQLAHCLDLLVVGLGYCQPRWDRKRQTLADKLCGTVVIVA